jgi:hypothetical protein
MDFIYRPRTEYKAMTTKLLNVFILSALAMLLIACAPIPIQNVESAPVNPSSTNYDLSDVTKAIQRAGAGLGWQMKEQTPGHIVGTLTLRKHVAVVDITYTLDDYSINYKDSTNLNYNPGANTIHKNYNGWITNLSNAITVQLTTL